MTLPLADATTTAAIKAWLDRFAGHVRAVDYAAARPFWHEDIVIFGTFQELVRSRAAWQATQWDNVWPRTDDFAFVLDQVLVLASPDGGMALAVAPWMSTGFHADGMRFDRPGRATIALVRGGEAGWLGVHSHMSLGKGVPQESHGKRAVRSV